MIYQKILFDLLGSSFKKTLLNLRWLIFIFNLPYQMYMIIHNAVGIEDNAVLSYQFLELRKYYIFIFVRLKQHLPTTNGCCKENRMVHHYFHSRKIS